MTSSLSKHFMVFAARECKGSSSLYEHLSEKIAIDDELLKLAAHARQGQPVPNLFFGAVHYLLLKGYGHELREFYASLVNYPRKVTEAFPHFKEFCLTNQLDMIPLLQNKLVQTNEVRRCSYLYPAFCYMYEKTKRPLALIEMGTSAGLQLLWDKYSYSYNSDNEIYGGARSELHIHAEIKGARRPVIFEQSPPVTSRIGLDLHINDLNDPEDYLWLNALIWPEHLERRIHFAKAAQCAKEQTLQFIEGDGVKLLPEIALQIPKESVLCVFHTHVANQIPTEGKQELERCIKKLSEERDVFHLYNNMWDSGLLHLDYYVGGKEYKETLAETEGHARWFQWKL
ncbi:DUF2332 domain-containing protein [Paenibacillus agilis]|uniref:DUF2332 domain-containing protein n=1 Tax=Paenibacillus agilis TaxID=3020863 RepID=A0A559J0S1_9BACL|nr:DUF2332 domain-containing protein [Paenibacillus agilis]TVX93480.1 DUF2332 domain-containing protein [Paenibacillus agilis]